MVYEAKVKTVAPRNVVSPRYRFYFLSLIIIIQFFLRKYRVARSRLTHLKWS